jgi:Phage integrase family
VADESNSTPPEVRPLVETPRLKERERERIGIGVHAGLITCNERGIPVAVMPHVRTLEEAKAEKCPTDWFDRLHDWAAVHDEVVILGRLLLTSDGQLAAYRALGIETEEVPMQTSLMAQELLADLRVLDAGFAPPEIVDRNKELRALVECAALPVGYRRLVALSVYLYMRPGELAVLRWRDVDLERGVVRAHRAHDRKTGTTKATKTGHNRDVRVEPPALALLRVMAEEGTSERVIPVEVWGNGATMTGNLDRQTRRLRRCLRVAGVDRPALHEAEATSKAMTWYDLRATGITWRAVRGDDPLRIMHAAGHTSFTTTQGYIRAAAAFSADAFGDVFQALSPLLGEQAKTAPRAPHSHTPSHTPSHTRSPSVAQPPGIKPTIQSGKGDSNPRPRAPKARALPGCAISRASERDTTGSAAHLRTTRATFQPVAEVVRPRRGARSAWVALIEPGFHQLEHLGCDRG